ncbi:MAG: hypothetical protein J6Y08_06995 [Clostridiales bacterium]|nr:hypothetical protein [Clostridiales bacterium]
MGRLERDNEFQLLLDMEVKKIPFPLRMTRGKQRILIYLILFLSLVWLFTLMFYPYALAAKHADGQLTDADEIRYHTTLYVIAGLDVATIIYYFVCNHYYKNAFREASRNNAVHCKKKMELAEMRDAKILTSRQNTKWQDPLDFPDEMPEGAENIEIFKKRGSR